MLPCNKAPFRHLGCPLAHLIDVADVQERLLGQIREAVGDFFEAAQRVGDARVLAFLAGELLGDVERLVEKTPVTSIRVPP